MKNIPHSGGEMTIFLPVMDHDGTTTPVNQNRKIVISVDVSFLASTKLNEMKRVVLCPG